MDALRFYPIVPRCAFLGAHPIKAQGCICRGIRYFNLKCPNGPAFFGCNFHDRRQCRPDVSFQERVIYACYVCVVIVVALLLLSYRRHFSQQILFPFFDSAAGKRGKRVENLFVLVYESSNSHRCNCARRRPSLCAEVFSNASPIVCAASRS